MEVRLKQAERRNVEHEDDYLAVWKAIKRPNETVLEACKRILLQRDELLAACEWAVSEFGKHTRPSPLDKAIAAVKGGHDE
jgi:hypothetical protein